MQTVRVSTNLNSPCPTRILCDLCRLKPNWALLVPESREGGDDRRRLERRPPIRPNPETPSPVIAGEGNFGPSRFLDPDPRQIDARPACARRRCRRTCTAGP